MSVEQVGKNPSRHVTPSRSAAAQTEQRLERDDRALRKWHGETAQAAAAFEGRWTWLTLRRVDPDIGERLWDQRGRFSRACVTGTADEIEQEGAALCRGYAIAAAKMLEVNAEDDAYSIGRCPITGTTVAISYTRSVLPRVRELFGGDVVWMTPDEIATLVADAKQFKTVAAIKRRFPGAEVMERHATQGTGAT